MPKFKTSIPRTSDDQIDVESWLEQFASSINRPLTAIIQQAVNLAQLLGEEQATPHGVSCLQEGLEVANILAELGLDDEAYSAAILYSSVQYASLPLEDVREQLSPTVEKLIKGAQQMDAVHISHGRLKQAAQMSTTIDNLRKMLLAMVEDVRVVMIKLAERLAVLKHMALFNTDTRRQFAEETMEVYAPLANRLGIGHLKWQLEDYAFRYLEPDKYQSLGRSLKDKRLEREQYVDQMLHELEQLVSEAEIKHVRVIGRAKHIYSIYKKMQRKKLGIEEIYDIIATRILVDTIQDCYAVLGAVHGKWEHIPKEFDDYIAKPKRNGYRSLHTAVITPSGRHVEIQIRTYEMHQEAELGVAAHWMYKEQKANRDQYEAKIAWLRQVISWQKEISVDDAREREAVSHIFDDRVYVFTPGGDVIDLPSGATPLDFAYHIHSEVGNRCRGAKINGKMMPLTYTLAMGDQVEVLTAKNAHPSRDWINPKSGYLTTSRARAKVHHYFRQLDYEENSQRGEDLLEKAVRKTGEKLSVTDKVLRRLHMTNKHDLFAAIGRGDLSPHAAVKVMQYPDQTEPLLQPKMGKRSKPKRKPRAPVLVAEVDSVMTHMAGCCKPIPGDAIVGYVTLGKGVSIHKKECGSVKANQKSNPERIVSVSWGSTEDLHYPVELKVTAHHAQTLSSEITHALHDAGITMLGLSLEVNKDDVAQVSLSVEVSTEHPLEQIVSKLKQISHVVEVRRS